MHHKSEIFEEFDLKRINELMDSSNISQEALMENRQNILLISSELCDKNSMLWSLNEH